MMIKAGYDDEDDESDREWRLKAGRCCPAPPPVRTINHQTSDRSQLAAGLRLLISVWSRVSPGSHHTHQTHQTHKTHQTHQTTPEWKDKE